MNSNNKNENNHHGKTARFSQVDQHGVSVNIAKIPVLDNVLQWWTRQELRVSVKVEPACACEWMRLHSFNSQFECKIAAGRSSDVRDSADRHLPQRLERNNHKDADE